MLSSYADLDQDNPLRGLLDRVDAVTIIHQAMSAGESPIIAVQPAKAVRTQVLNRLLPGLRRGNIRIIEAMSLDGAQIDLNSLMDQVLGRGGEDVKERSERFYVALTRPEAAETRLMLIIDDAHLLTDQTFRYLELITVIARVNPLPLQIMLLGGPEIWDRLPRTGSFAADNVALRISLPDEPVAPELKMARPDGLAPRVTGMKAAADQTATAPVTAKAPVVEAPATDKTQARDKTQATDKAMASEARPPVTSNIPLFDNLLERSAQVEVRPRPAIRGRLVLAACACMVVVGGGGLTAGGLLDEPLDPHNLTRLIPTDQVTRWLGRFDPVPSSEGVRPAAVITAMWVPPSQNATPSSAASDATSTSMAELPRVSKPVTVSLAPVQPPSDPPHGDVLTGIVSPEAVSTPHDINRPEAVVTDKKQELPEQTATPIAATTGSGGDSGQISPSAVAAPPAAPSDVTANSATSDALPSAAPSNIPPSADTVAQPDRHAPAVIALTSISGPESTPDRTVLSGVAPAASVTPPPSPGTQFAALSVRPLTNPTEQQAHEPEAPVSPAFSAPAATGQTGSQQFSPGVVAILIARGDELLGTGDITAARLMYQRAAGSNSAQAAIAMGLTYDPRFLAQAGVRGIAAEPERAIAWYQRAADLGRPEGARLLASLQVGDGR